MMKRTIFVWVANMIKSEDIDLKKSKKGISPIAIIIIILIIYFIGKSQGWW